MGKAALEGASRRTRTSRPYGSFAWALVDTPSYRRTKYFGARRFFGAGLRLGARIPIPTERVRFFVGTGLNYVGVVAPSKEYALVRPTYTVEGTLLEAGGRMLEVPLTLGAALPLAKDFHLLLQGGASMSFAQSGSYYDSPSTLAEYRLRQIRTESGSVGGIGGGGIDTFAWFATLGLMFEAPR